MKLIPIQSQFLFIGKQLMTNYWHFRKFFLTYAVNAANYPSRRRLMAQATSAGRLVTNPKSPPRSFYCKPPLGLGRRPNP